jgi:tRNA pseudouridine55 synthase
MKDGILIVNKPKGITSHDVVDHVRRVLRIRRVGHSGTLDPLASGVLVMLIGKGTKLFKEFLNFDKEYNATLTLGETTDTGDAYGKVLKVSSIPPIDERLIGQVFKEFLGEIQQIPPMVSAVRYKGKRLYQLARKGIEIPRRPRKVTIKELRLLKFNPPEIRFYVCCSSGTYIRQLASDLAQRFGCCGYISEIERQSVGPYNLKDAFNLDQINESHIRPWKVCN